MHIQCASRRGDRGQSISAQDEKAQDYLNQPLLDSVRPILLIMYMYIEKDGQGGAYPPPPPPISSGNLRPLQVADPGAASSTRRAEARPLGRAASKE